MERMNREVLNRLIKTEGGIKVKPNGGLSPLKKFILDLHKSLKALPDNRIRQNFIKSQIDRLSKQSGVELPKEAKILQNKFLQFLCKPSESEVISNFDDGEFLIFVKESEDKEITIRMERKKKELQQRPVKAQQHPAKKANVRKNKLSTVLLQKLLTVLHLMPTEKDKID